MIQRQKADSSRRSRSGEKSVLVRSGGLTGFARLAADRRYRATFAPAFDNDHPIARSPLVGSTAGCESRVPVASLVDMAGNHAHRRLPPTHAAGLRLRIPGQTSGQAGKQTNQASPMFNATTMLHVEHRFFRPKRNPAVPGFSDNSVPRGTSVPGQRRSGITT